MGEERKQATKVDVDKLLNVGFNKEARYATSLANVVLKASRKWRMCIDYINFKA